MRDSLFSMKNIVYVVFAMLVNVSSASQLYAQRTCDTPTRTGNPITQDAIDAINNAIRALQAQGATVTCDNMNMYVTFPDGTFFNLTVSNDGAIRLYSFSPATGQSTYVYIVGETLYIQDSVYGFINAGDGWYSIFYPVGNPFSASIQDPMQVLFQENLPPEIRELESGWGPRRPPVQPIQP